jgi:UDP-N-acetylmuramyl pentapeptide phosphotransferase/UDP-N-acetylglucosamine-1-phosphate transferase
VPIATLVLASSIGFIIFNWYPAKIFLGDVGSISLGFLLGLCLLLIAASNINLFVAVIIASLYYLADGGLTILIRLFHREKIWEPHLQHFFQKAVKKGMSHNKIVNRIIICNLLLMLLAINALYFPIISIILASAVVTLILVSFIEDC